MAKNAGPIINRSWTKVHDILRRCRRPRGLKCISPIMYIMFVSEDID